VTVGGYETAATSKEPAETKADALQQELNIIQKEHGKQGELVQEIQSTKLALVEQQELQQSQIQQLQNKKEEISKEFAKTKEQLESLNQELKEELKTRSEEIFQLQIAKTTRPKTTTKRRCLPSTGH
jgi:chromosome segregation ATPase